MPRGKLSPMLDEVKGLLAQNADFLRPLAQTVLQELLEAEMTAAPGVEQGGRTPVRRGRRGACCATAPAGSAAAIDGEPTGVGRQ